MEAIDEIAALPKDSVYRQKVLELFASLKVNLEASTDRDPDDMELPESSHKVPHLKVRDIRRAKVQLTLIADDGTVVLLGSESQLKHS